MGGGTQLFQASLKARSIGSIHTCAIIKATKEIDAEPMIIQTTAARSVTDERHCFVPGLRGCRCISSDTETGD